MPERVFLCGLSAEQRACCPEGTALSLEPKVGNLILKLDRMRNRLVGSEPKRLTDFVEIASYVFAADRTTKRGAPRDPGFGAEWRRTFRMIVAVRDYAFWNRSDIGESMSETLAFLSEDQWQFEFVENQQPIQLQRYLDWRHSEADLDGGTSVVLFSGGLDSLAGAVHELRHTNRHVVLTSHRNLPTVGRRQLELASALAHAYPRRVTHVWVDNKLTKKLSDCEETQRTRSFFFTAVGAVAAHIEFADRIRFYENGIMSINLPLATQVVGARASRSTHPRSLQLLARLLDLVTIKSASLDNPFVWSTKGEVVGELASSPQASLIRGSVSCTRARTVNKQFQPHCGTCIQCLHRRLSTLVGNAAEYDEAEGYEIDFLTGPRADGPDRVMAVETLQQSLDCASCSDSDFLSRFAGPLSWVLQAYPVGDRPETGKQILDLHRRHGLAVRDLLIKDARAYTSDLVDRKLPPDSLLALLLAGSLSDVKTPTPAPASEPQDPVIERERSVSGDALVVAIDERRKCIRLRDLPEIRGQTIFPLICLLIEMSLEDRGKPGSPDDYRGLQAKAIADRLDLDDAEAIRAAVKRARDQLAYDAAELGWPPMDANALIQSSRKGYRLNPAVIVVPIADL